jgi:hypothetical protein
MKTIGQQINWNFETYGSLEIRNKNHNPIYYENPYGDWYKWEYDSNGNEIYFETSNKHWKKKEYDSENNLIYVEDSEGDWSKWEYDSKGNQIYFEGSNGKIVDNRPKPCENKEIEIDGKKYKLVKV